MKEIKTGKTIEICPVSGGIGVRCPHCGEVYVLSYVRQDNLYTGECPRCGKETSLDAEDVSRVLKEHR